MMKRSFANVMLATYVVICCALPASVFGQAAPAPNASPALEKLKASQGNFSLAILPVVIPDVPVDTATRVQFATGLAVTLERTGLKSIDVLTDDFTPPADGPNDLDALAAAVTAYVKQHPPKADYVYCLEYRGKPQTPANAVLTVIADRSGEIVWKMLQDAKDADFSKMKPDNVLAGTTVSAEPFRRELSLKDPAGKDVYLGKWDTYFKDKSKKRLAAKTAGDGTAAAANPAAAPVAVANSRIWAIIGAVAALSLLVAVLGLRMMKKKE